MLRRHAFLSACLSFIALAPAIRAQDAEKSFHEAYYLEVEEGNLEAAIRRYEEAARAPGAPAELAERARRRAAGCRELLAAADPARLVPAEVLAYVEVRRPAGHLARILRLTGLLGAAGAEGASPPPAQEPPPFTVSPRLLEGLDGLEGAAVAITEIDPRQGIPRGVAVLNPGRNDLLYGLVETMLSGASTADVFRRAEPVEGHAAYVSPFATIVLTQRLIVAGSSRELAEEAVRRLHGSGTLASPSLATSANLAEPGARREGALVFAFADAQRLLDLARREMFRGGRPTEEYRIVQAVADIESLRWAALRIGTAEQTVTAELSLALAEGNHSLAYHLLRTPAVRRETFRAVPSGAAACLAMGFADEAAGAPPAPAASREGVTVTGLDIGREVFANLREAVVFVLPPGAAARAERRGLPVPDAAAVFTVRDSTRSQALWNTLLALPAVVNGAGPEAARSEEVEGRPVRVYTLPGPVEVYLAAEGERVILAVTKPALSRALAAAGGKETLFDDQELKGVLEGIAAGANKAVLVHAGRTLEVARAFDGISDREAEQMAAALKGTTVTISTSETPTSFRASIAATLPDLGLLLRQMQFAKGGRGRGGAVPAGFEKF